MKKILVLYKSKYGSTKKYVDMLKEEVSCNVSEISSYSFSEEDQYDLIILAGGIYASGISVMKYVRKNQHYFINKDVILLAVGASPYDEKAMNDLKAFNMKNISFHIPMFYGRGAYDESVMNFKDRTLCRLLKKSLSKKDPATFEPWMKALFEADGKSNDWTDKKYLEPLLEYIKRS